METLAYVPIFRSNVKKHFPDNAIFCVLSRNWGVSIAEFS